MPITLTAEPAVIDGARSYAEHRGMTLEVFMLAYLESAAKRERRDERLHGLRMEHEFSPSAGPGVAVPSLVESISGIVHLPEGMSDADLIGEAIMQKYEDAE